MQNGLVLFADLVAVSDAVDELGPRRDKVARLSKALRATSPADRAVVASLLTRARDASDAMFDAVEPPAYTALSCTDVADAIAKIDLASPDRRRRLVHQLMVHATVDERRWITAAIHNPRLDRHSFDLVVSSTAATSRVTVSSVRRAATLTGSLPLSVRIAFERGEAGLESVVLEPGRPMPPTFPEEFETPDCLLLAPSTRLVEWNVDADRIQVHRRHGEVTVYDDQLEDVTGLAPVVVEQVASLPGGDLVLDGWVDLDGVRTSASPAVAGWTRRTGGKRVGRRPLFFDVFFHEAPVVDEPLANRRALLASVVPGHLQLPILEVTDLDGIAASMNESRQLGHDGLILKPLDAPYEGGLVRSSWRRVKSAHIVKLGVVAAEHGAGSRAHLLSTVHLAARNHRNRLQEVGRTARGLSHETIVGQTAAFADLVLDRHDGGSRNVIRLRPEIVAVVAIEGVDQRDGSSPDLTLSRPRVIGYQYDTVDVTTVRALSDIAREARDTDAVPAPDASRREPSSGSDAVGTVGLPHRLALLPAPFERKVDTEPVRRESSEPSMKASPASTPNVHPATADKVTKPSEEPVKLPSKWSGRGVVIARVAALFWVVAILLAALDEQSGSVDIDSSTIALLGRIGIGIVALLVVSGWAWCDQLVRAQPRLDDPRPGRLRCVFAWLATPIVVTMIAILIVPLDPTEPVDIRPAVIAASFGLAMWQPYGLIRRILRSSTHKRSDVLVTTAYTIDIAGFGIIWWGMTLWGRDGEVSLGEIAILAGAAAAVAISMALSFPVWFGLLAAARNDVTSRPLGQPFGRRRRRLHAGHPAEPEARRPRVERQTDERLEAATSAIAPDTAAPDTAAVPQTVDDLISGPQRQPGVDFRRLADEESALVERRPRAELAEIPPTEQSQSASDGYPVGAGPSGRPTDLSDAARVDATARHDRSSVSEDGDEDPIDALRRRPARNTSGEHPRKHIEVVLEGAGSQKIGADPAEHEGQADGDGTTEGTAPPKLTLVKSARRIMVGAFAALTVVTAWVISLSLSSEAVAGTGELSASVVADLELARQIFWGLFTAGGALLPVWSVAIVRQARLAGIVGLRWRLVRVLALLAIAASICGFVFDGADRGTLTLLLSLPIIWSAVASGFCVEPARTWFDLPAATLTAWIATLPAILGVAWLAGLSAPIEATVSLQRLAFTSILLALGCARVTVMAVLSSLDIEDELSTSPESAAPARTTVRT